jgi:hypothetical protein
MYMAWGPAAIEEAEASMQSLWKRCSLPVMVVGDEAAAAHFAGRPRVTCAVVNVDPFDRTRRAKVQFLAGRVKPLLYGLSPWDQTLYVDADSDFVADPAMGFDLLGQWDFVLAETETRSLRDSIAGAEETLWTAQWLGTPHLLYHNSGMLFWRRCGAVERLMELWSEEWLRFEGWDEQVALLRALLRSDALYLTVPHTWNCRFTIKSALLHHRFGVGTARDVGAMVEQPPIEEGDQNRMVRVQVGRRRWIQCRAFEAEVYRERYARGNY